MNRVAGAAHIAILALIAAYFLIFPIYRGFFPLEIAPNESWNAYWQDAASGSGPLYPASDELVVNNYPPLSFYVIGGIALLTGANSLFVGRALSVAATLGLSFIIAIVIRQCGAGRAAAAVGAAWFVATMAGPFNQFVGMDDPQLFGQFIMGCALAWFLARDARGLAPEPPILLMVVTGFWKHNIIAIPATVLLWLVFRDGRRAIRPGLVGIGGVLAGLALCLAIYGEVFFANLLAPREFLPWRMLTGVGRLQFVLPALAVWVIWAWYERHTPAARFTAVFIGIALTAHVAQWGGDSVVNNSQFDLVIAVAIGLGLAYDRAAITGSARKWSGGLVRTFIIALVAVRLLATGRVEPALILLDPNYRRVVFEHADVARSEAVRVAAISGDVGCSNKLVCRMAGKPFVYDDFKVEELLNTGALTPMSLSKLLVKRGIHLTAIDQRSVADSIERDWLAKVFFGARWD